MSGHTLPQRVPLHLNQLCYRPDDKLYFWGVVAPTKEVSPVTQVRVELYGAPNEEEPIYGQPMPLETIALPVTGHTYTGSLQLPNLSPGRSWIEVWVDDTLLQTGYFEIQT